MTHTWQCDGESLLAFPRTLSDRFLRMEEGNLIQAELPGAWTQLPQTVHVHCTTPGGSLHLNRDEMTAQELCNKAGWLLEHVSHSLPPASVCSGNATIISKVKLHKKKGNS